MTSDFRFDGLMRWALIPCKRLSFILGLCLLGSCSSPELGGLAAPAAVGAVQRPFRLPLCVVRYFPYGVSLDRRVAAPIPDYRGWTDERMAKDLARMARAGIDVVSVEVTAEIFSQVFRRERFSHFVALASRPGGNFPRVVFELGSGFNYQPMLAQQFTDWFVGGRIGELPGYYREKQRPVVLLGEGAENVPVRHPALRYRLCAGKSAEWRWAHRSYEELKAGLCGNVEILAVCAGSTNGRRDRRGRLVWEIPRRRGRMLRDELRLVPRVKPSVVLISSWNNFRRGDFVEPNSLDQSRALDTLTREISRWKRMVQEQ